MLIELSQEELEEVTKRFGKHIVRGLPVEERLESAELKDLLKSLAPEERLEGLDPRERLEGLGPEGKLEILAALKEMISPEEMKKFLDGDT